MAKRKTCKIKVVCGRKRRLCWSGGKIVSNTAVGGSRKRAGKKRRGKRRVSKRAASRRMKNVNMRCKQYSLPVKPGSKRRMCRNICREGNKIVSNTPC